LDIPLGFSIISLLLSFWALYWSRRSAMAAEKSAAAAETNTAIANDALELAKQKTLHEKTQARVTRLDGLVREAIDGWRSKGSLHEIVDREPSLTDDEIDQLVRRVFASLGKPTEKAERCLADLLERRRLLSDSPDSSASLPSQAPKS
jgi:uncharacterized protein YfaQ (DUF2300 family)